MYTDITPICEGLKLAVRQCNQDCIAMSFIKMSEGTSEQSLNQLDPSFMYTQIFKEILLEMEYNEQSIRDLADYCRELYSDNTRQLNIINEFEHNYRSKSPIWWYTRECFTYQMLNRALRTLQGDTIINMGFFIHELHQQIRELYQKQIGNYHKNSFIVYRGQGLLKIDFDKLLKTQNGLMSFNNFLSTSTNRDVSFRFAKSASTKIDMVGILFKMDIDSSLSSVPFAAIPEVSYYKTEEEILFSMHTVFRIGEITKIDNNNSLYRVDLQLTADNDQELRTLTDRIREEVVSETGWRRLGKLLLKIGQFNKAEEVYNVLLEQSSDQSEKALYYNQLGYIKRYQDDYTQAIWYYEKAIEIRQKTIFSNHPDLAYSYNNIGLVYSDMGECSKPLSYYRKALQIQQEILPTNHPDLAISFTNIGSMYVDTGEYSKALTFYEKAVEIQQKVLPSNHPDLATAYNNIGIVYETIGQYSSALSFNNKSLEIRQKTLPPNHPLLANSYRSIGAVYKNTGNYSKALSCYEKAFEIQEKILPPNHPDLATTFSNIGLVYLNMGEYLKARSFYEKAFQIFQKVFPSNHPDLASCAHNIGATYDETEECSKALSFYEKAFEIFENVLPPNYPSLATSCNSIGRVYAKTGQYSKALSYYQKALKTFEKTLPLNHPSLATCYSNIAVVYCNMEEYSEALSCLTHALDILQLSSPANHPQIRNVQEMIDLIKMEL
jgi:tetratricopeptide (TPR) repeat protein